MLEIGTGSGYQAAILGELAREVYTIEIVPELAERGKRVIAELGYKNVHVRAGDGYDGWPEHAPFDSVIVTAAPDHVPQPLVDQVKVGGRLVVPVGTRCPAAAGLYAHGKGTARGVAPAGAVRAADAETVAGDSAGAAAAVEWSSALSGRSGGTGRRAGLKIPFPLRECGFDPLLRHQPSPACQLTAGYGWQATEGCPP